MAIATNIREKAEAITQWLGWHHESIAYGLKSVADAEKLYDYWQANDTLPEFSDDCDDVSPEEMAQHRVAAIGYDPLVA